MKRTYPIGEWQVQQPTSNSYDSSSMQWWFVTTWKHNPYKGWRRPAFAFDEWAHRHGLNARGPLRLFCNWLDPKL